MAPTPHYLRFARAVALVSCVTSLSGSYASHQRPGDAPDAAGADAARPDAASPDTSLADAGPPDAGDPCASCECDYVGGRPDSCEARGLWQCCAVQGPLAPPELAT